MKFAGLLALIWMLPAQAATCERRVYLTFDTGSQSQAEYVARTLKAEGVRATFFLANEKTVRGDYALDAGWADFWKGLAADGHAFGSHSYDHSYVQAGAPAITVRSQFGAAAGRTERWDGARFCAELKRVDTRFFALTGQHLDPIWRAPGGRTTAATLAAARACGYRHVGWSPAGFSGDELPSERFSNAHLLKKMLTGLADGDIIMAHLGIWSRRDPWMPANLEPLIHGLRARGFCFATLREHPAYLHPSVP